MSQQARLCSHTSSCNQHEPLHGFMHSTNCKNWFSQERQEFVTFYTSFLRHECKVLLFYWYFKVFSTDQRQLVNFVVQAPMTIKIFISIPQTLRTMHFWKWNFDVHTVFLQIVHSVHFIFIFIIIYKNGCISKTKLCAHSK